jgi:glycosyltransferase involved in cell wall biosynthesis
MRVLLVGNYVPDRQESMLRYVAALRAGLRSASVDVRDVSPRVRFNGDALRGGGAWTWSGYVDKLVFAPTEIARAADWADVVHVCDQSNAFYVPHDAKKPWLVTCHDLLAVRAALGESTDCPVSASGHVLQRLILAGLRRASMLLCVSDATARDARRLVPGIAADTVPIPLNHPFRQIPEEERVRRLAAVPGIRDRPYLLMVGSNLRRKNRALAVRMFARIADRWPGALVFAGEPAAPELVAEALGRGLGDRIVDVPGPSADLLEALYGGATCLLFPSTFEGFGWPLVEAQACGCPVVASDVAPHPEVTAGAALLVPLDDEHRFDAAVLAISSDGELRAELVRRGLENVRRFAPNRVIGDLVHRYRLASGGSGAGVVLGSEGS